MKTKPKVGFFDFACCEGCQVELTNIGSNVFLELTKHVDIIEFREVMTETAGKLDIAFIEGSFTREADRERLEDTRARSKIVIAYGACAATACVNALKNNQNDYTEFVYGKDAKMPHLQSQDALPISAVIKVDYSLNGCPMNANELLNVVTDLVHGKEPLIPNYPVCVECKRRETTCRYHLGDHCMGQVARAGCNAPCPADGIPCEACRGFVDNPNEKALEKVLIKFAGFSKRRARDKSRMFTAAVRGESK